MEKLNPGLFEYSILAWFFPSSECETSDRITTHIESILISDPSVQDTFILDNGLTIGEASIFYILQKLIKPESRITHKKTIKKGVKKTPQFIKYE
jgi:hypothetical protein